VDLHIRHFQFLACLQKAAGLKPVRGADTGFEEDILHARHQLLERVRDLAMQRDGLRAFLDHRAIKVILQVLPDAGQIGDDIDAEFAQVIGLADARQHERLGRVDRAAAQNDFRIGISLLRLFFLHIFNADGLAAFKEDARGQRFDFHRQIGTAERRHEVALGRAAALTVLDRVLVRADAFLLRAVEVVRIRMAGLLACFDEGIEKHIGAAPVGNAERPVAAMERVIAVLIAFRAAEIGQHIGEAPALKAHLTPHVIVARMAANIDHAVDGGRTAQHLAARPVKLAVVQMLLAFGPVIPVGEFIADQLADACRHMKEDALVLAARFQKQDFLARIGGQAVGQNAAGAAGPDNDVIVTCHKLPFSQLPWPAVSYRKNVAAMSGSPLPALLSGLGPSRPFMMTFSSGPCSDFAEL
jgi:hypothetical protein